MSPDALCPEGERPAALGYRWPAEWEPHTATWLAWPHNQETWPGKFDTIPPVWAELVRVLSEHETVNILAGGDAVIHAAESAVGSLANVVLHNIPTNDAWTRDHGPMFLQHTDGGEPALVDWQYNAWGGKYPPFDDDNAVAQCVAKTLDMRRFAADLVLETGAIDGNGCGVLLAAESSLLNSNRNPNTSRDAMQQALADYCGVKQVVWIDAEFAGDDTDGHVDQLVRFVGPRTVVVATEEDKNDVNYTSLVQLKQQLVESTNGDGKPLDVVPLPMPRALYYNHRRLPASYANFYIANGVVIVPQFDDPADQRAISILAEQFPTRRVVGIRAVDLVWGLGTFHCITQQQPV